MNLFFSETYDDLRHLLVNQLRDLYDAEHRILENFPAVIEKATSSELRLALEDHKHETEGHISMLKQVFEKLGEQPKRATCEACKGLIKEGSTLLDARGNPAVIDAGLILAQQRIEHYEIAGHGGARALAIQLGETEVAELLGEILEEEKAADATLSSVAISFVNESAAEAHSTAV